MMGEMGKNVWYLYQGRRVNSQTAAGGGALTTRISMNAGQVGKIVAIRAQGPASNTTLSGQHRDEDNAYNATLIAMGAGVSNSSSLPSIGTAASTTGNVANSTDMLIGPGAFLAFSAAAALQNETLEVGVVLLLSSSTEPVWDTTGSAGTPSLAASTISAANTMQAVLM